MVIKNLLLLLALALNDSRDDDDGRPAAQPQKSWGLLKLWPTARGKVAG
jgi:hypothetical protein